MLGVPYLARAADGKPLRIVTSSFPPLVIEGGGERPGAQTEIVLELCRRLGLVPAIEFVPWPRAIHLASHVPATAIFPLTRLPMRERQFRWLAPLFEENFCFVAPRGGKFDVQQPDRMQAMRIAMIRGGTQGALLREWGYRHLVEAKSIREVHRFLAAGMADAAFGERNIIRASLVSQGAEADYVVSAPLRSTMAWLAGSLDFTEADAAAYQRALDAIVADGSKQRILARYNLA